MPFGQAGFNVGQDSGGFGNIFGTILSSLPDILSQVPGVIGAIRGQPQQRAIAAPAGQAFSFPGLGLGEPGTVLGEILGGGVPPLFKQTMTRTVPISEFSVISPTTGKCETWLHARPFGWKINKSNVRGRRRHHHHPR